MQKSNLIRIDSSEVQGPDSFVTLRRPSWKMMRTMAKAQAGATTDAEIGMVALETIMPDLIVDWNWAKEDEDGTLNRLQLPSQQSDVLDNLDFEEVMFLIKHVTPLLSTVNARPN